MHHKSTLLLLAMTMALFSSRAEAFGTATQKTRSSLATNKRLSFLPSPTRYASSSSLSSSSYPAMTTQEIENFLSNIPIYAITISQTEKLNAGGLVMLSEPNNPYNIACFFFNPLHANAIFAPLREKESNIKWDVTGFSLGSIWMDVMKNDFSVEEKKDGNGGVKVVSCVQEDVEYRILADPKDLMEARTLLVETAEKEEGGEVPSVFQSSYNEIPVFFHDKLRLMADAGKDGEEEQVLFPMYFSLQDLKEAHGQITGDEMEEEQYKSEVKIGDLRTIVQQMQSDSATTDYRKVVLVPPTPPEQPAAASTSSGVEKSQSKGDDTSGDTLNLPTTGDWSD